MKKFIIVLVSIVSSLTVTARSESPTPTPPAGSASIEGNVRDGSGSPIGGAKVRAHLHSWGEFESFSLTAETDSSGTYGFYNLPAANVNLSVKADGYTRLKRERIKLGRDERITGIDFTLQEGLAISGRVQDSNAEPLKGIGVTAKPEYDEGLPKPNFRQATVTVQTGEDGRYTVPSIEEGSYTVKTSSKQYIPEEITNVAAGSQNVDFTLRGGGSLSGTVRDKTSGQPIEKAYISIEAEQSTKRRTSAKTDENGSYKISTLDTGSYTLKATAKGYMKATRPGVTVRVGQATDGINFSLLPQPRIRGTVTLEGGGVAKGTELRLSSAGSFITGLTGRLFYGKADGVADEYGRYEIVKGKPGKRYIVTAYLPGYVSAVSEPFQLVPGRDQEGVDFSLKKGCSLSGRVTDEKQNPVSGAKVKTGKKGGFGPFDSDLGTSSAKGQGIALTDDTGNFTLSGIEPGSYKIQVSAKGYSTANVDNVKFSEDSKSEPLKIVLQAGLTISGRVTDSSGKPLHGAKVWAFGSGETGYVSRRTETDEEGRYEIVSLSSGSYKVRTRLKGYSRERTEGVEPPAEDIDFVLSSGGRIAGRVLDRESGRSVTRFRYMTDQAPYSKKILFKYGKEQVSEDGTFETKPLDPGDYAVTVSADGYAPERVEGIEVESGKTVQVDIRLRPAASIKGEILNEKTRQPVPGARISLLKPKEDDTFGFTTDTDLLKEPHLSDETGSFRIDNLHKGSFRLKVTHPDFADETEAVELKKEGEELTVKIAINKGRVVSGSVLDKNSSNPIAGANVSISSDADEDPIKKIFRSFMRKSGATAVSDSGGQWEIANVAPGEYGIQATHNDYAASDAKRITVKPDADVTGIKLLLSSGARISGTVRDATGKAVSKTGVMAMGESGMKKSDTDKSGRYLLEHLSPGAHTISVMPKGENFTVDGISKQVSIAPNDNITLDFTIEGDLSISGKILQEGSPAEGVYISLSKEEAGERVYGSGKSKADGSYSIGGLAPGSYDLMLNKRRAKKRFFYKLPQAISISANLTDYDITVPTGTIRGTIVDEDGNPLEKVRVRLKKREEKKEKRLAVPWEEEFMAQLTSEKSDLSGNFEFSTLDAGSYLLTTTKRGFGQLVEAVTLDSDSSHAELKITLKRGYTVKLNILNAQTGKPLEKAVIRLKDKNGTTVKTETVSAKAGLFTIGDLSAGTYRLEVAAEGRAPAALDSVKVGPDSKKTLELKLDKGCSLTVGVSGEKGKKLMGALVELVDSSGKSYQPLWLEARRGQKSVVTNSNGELKIDCLPEGSFTVKASKVGYKTAEAKITIGKSKANRASLTLKK